MYITQRNFILTLYPCLVHLAPVVDLLTGNHHRSTGRHHSRREWATDVYHDLPWAGRLGGVL